MGYRRLEFSNEHGTIKVGSKGAALLSYKHRDQWIIPEFSGEKESDRWKTGYVLFPFPARLYEGRVFEFDTTTWHWPLNDLSKTSAIHGLTAYQEFSLATSNSGISAVWEYDGGQHCFPFPCQLIIHYKLTSNGLEQYVHVTNLGSNALPFHLGWHPYFIVEGSWSLHGLLQSEYRYNAMKHPNGVFEFSGLDNQSELDKAVRAFDSKPELRLEDQKKVITINGMTPWYQIFKPVRSKFIAVEPLTGVGHPDTPWETLAPGQDKVFINTLTVDLK